MVGLNAAATWSGCTSQVSSLIDSQMLSLHLLQALLPQRQRPCHSLSVHARRPAWQEQGQHSRPNAPPPSLLRSSRFLPSVCPKCIFKRVPPIFVFIHPMLPQCSGAWVLLYTVEAAAIASLMSRNTGKTQPDINTALSALPSRKMFPAPLTPVKDALAHTLAAGANTLAPGNTAAAAVLSAAAASIAEQQAQESATPLELVAAPPGG